MGFDVITYALLKKLSGSVDKKIEGLSEGMTFKGSVPTKDDLPSGATGGDLYIIKDTGNKAVWDGSEWLEFDYKIQALDNSILVKGSKVGVILSSEPGNALVLKDDGLFVEQGEIDLPAALKASLKSQKNKNSGLVVDDENNILVSVNTDHLNIVDNKIDLDIDLIQAIEN